MSPKRTVSFKKRIVATCGHALLLTVFVVAHAAEAVEETKKIIVVGGGLAGVMAAKELTRQGHEVLLLEKENRLGGPMVASSSGEVPLDLGSQLIPSKSKKLLALIGELGLLENLVQIDPTVAVAREGKIYWTNLAHSISLPWSGYLKWREIFNPNLLWKLSQGLTGDGRPIDDIVAWQDLDSETVESWSQNSGFGRLQDWVLDPILSPLLAEVGTASKSSAFWISDYVSGSHKIYRLKGGMGQIFERLASRLQVHYGVHVKSLEVVKMPGGMSERVVLRTSKGEYVANRVILTSSANVTKKVFKSGHCANEAQVLGDANYYSSLVLSVKTNRAWNVPKSELGNAYALLFPAGESKNLRAMAVGSTFEFSDANENAFQIYFRDEFTKNYLLTRSSQKSPDPFDEQEVANLALTEIDKYLPGFSQSRVHSALKLWLHAVPVPLPGRAALISTYRKNVENGQCRVIMAGDFLNFSGLEPVVFSGVWAAKQAARP